MNPILLKPEADAHSQIVVLGRAVARLSASEYYRRRPEFWEVARGALDRLRDRYDLVIIEGAGSPAEINLQASDIVNMRVARHTEAPVLLVGDIDRGGVFAALVGTMELLEPDDRRRVRGLILNKFRGDPALLGDGLAFLEQRTGVPVLGVVPYLAGHGIAEEDSVALDHRPRGQPQTTALDVAVIRLPHISNFDDLDPLEAEAGVSVRYIKDPRHLGRPDLIVLPGTKTTMADLDWLRQTGLDRTVRGAHAEGTFVLGICGGYQMLGTWLLDPDGVESPRTRAAGLRLLPAISTFAPAKLTRQVSGVARDHGALPGIGGRQVAGYEIHMGRTEATGAALLELTDTDGQSRADGCVSGDGQVLGTYLHGLFDRIEFRRAFLAAVAGARGRHLEFGPPPPSRDERFDRLAEALRGSLDLARLREVCGLG